MKESINIQVEVNPNGLLNNPHNGHLLGRLINDDKISYERIW